MNTPSLQVPKLVFGHDTGARVQGRLSLCAWEEKWAPSPCVCAPFTVSVSLRSRRHSCLYHTRILEISSLALKHQHLTQTKFLLVLGMSTALYSLLSSCFEMASDKAKWSNFIQSHISSTKSVNTKPFCAGIQALIPEYQVWTSP